MHLTTSMLPFAAAIVVTVMQPTFAAGQVPPPTAPRFGVAGQTIINSEFKLDLQFDSTDFVDARGEEQSLETTTYDFHVGLDRVVGPGLTAGVRLGFVGYSRRLAGDLETERRFDLGGRVGLLQRLGGSTIVWPRLGLTYAGTSYGFGGGSALGRTLAVNVSAPFLWSVGRRVLIGVGPSYDRDIYASFDANDGGDAPKTSGFGIHGFLGFWF